MLRATLQGVIGSRSNWTELKMLTVLNGYECRIYSLKNVWANRTNRRTLPRMTDATFLSPFVSLSPISDSKYTKTITTKPIFNNKMQPFKLNFIYFRSPETISTYSRRKSRNWTEFRQKKNTKWRNEKWPQIDIQKVRCKKKPGPILDILFFFWIFFAFLWSHEILLFTLYR